VIGLLQIEQLPARWALLENGYDLFKSLVVRCDWRWLCLLSFFRGPAILKS
jgi:hypothetical protein